MILIPILRQEGDRKLLTSLSKTRRVNLNSITWSPLQLYKMAQKTLNCRLFYSHGHKRINQKIQTGGLDLIIIYSKLPFCVILNYSSMILQE